MCEFTFMKRNPNYLKRKDEFSHTPIPCGICSDCTKKKASQWYIRIKYELKRCTTAFFVTLTYTEAPRSDHFLLTGHKPDLQKFYKRLRQKESQRVKNPATGRLKTVYNQDIKHYSTLEYGEKNHRPHYHAIIFNVKRENIFKAWTLGRVQADLINDARINYVVGYIGKKIGIPFHDADDRLKEFSVMSKGLGDNYQEITDDWNKNNMIGYTILDGITYALPRYYKNRIFTESELLIIKKLNYDAYIKNQAKKIANYGSELSFQKNSGEIARRNQTDKFITNLKNSTR